MKPSINDYSLGDFENVDEYRNWKFEAIAKLELQLQQAQAELAGMKLIEAEGEAFGETIVRENERLREELEKAVFHINYITGQLQQVQEERDVLVNETDVLIELLKEYGDHHWTCDSTHGTGLPCDCVYGATLEKYATRKEIEDGEVITEMDR